MDHSIHKELQIIKDLCPEHLKRLLETCCDSGKHLPLEEQIWMEVVNV